jgi:predicted ATPase/class 3 adenylate cyclase
LSTETLTFLFTDIEGSTALLKRLGEDVYADVLADHHSLIRSCIATHGGREVSTQGDGFFAVFSSPRACASAVIEMQRGFGAHEWPAGEQLRVRMGVHFGEASENVTGLYGLEVHRAARIAAVARGGQILLSATAAGLVRDWLPAGASLRDLGLHRLKDLGRPEQIFQLQGEGLQFEFPPLRSLDNPELPNNLPAQSAPFVGRSLEVTEVRRLAESSRLVTLTGAGGSGKTRLCLQVAADLLDGSGDGVWLVELAPVSEQGAVASTISQVLGIMSHPGRPALETLLDALSPQQVLIVLDNCEHLIDDCAKVADAILRRCPRVHLLTTSREPLGIGGETIYRVPSLSLPGPNEDDLSEFGSSDAVALFVDRASAQAVDFVLNQETSPLVVSICRRLDGMPLAIELAVARLRSLSLANLHDRLDQRFRLLTGGSRSALPRQQTLRATVDWSYSLLSGPEQSLLRRLSVFAEGFELKAAEEVCALADIEVFDVTSLLGSLVDKSLVVAEPTGGTARYRLLETIRQFAAERLVETDEREAAAVGAAHCAHYLSLAELAAPHLTGPEQGRWLRLLDADQANLRRAMEHTAVDTNGTALVLRFAVALRRFLWARSQAAQEVRLLTSVLERAEAETEPELLSAALVSLAGLVGSIDTGAALRAGERAVEIARQLDEERLLVESLSMLCAVYYFAGEPDKGFPLGREAVERARLLGDDILLGTSLMLYLLSSQPIDPASTEQVFTEAIACTQRSGDQYVISVLQNNAGVYALEAGNVPQARSHLELAVEAEQAIGAVIPNVSINLGWVLREEGDADGAASMFEKASRVSRRNGHRVGVAYANLGLACLATDRGDWHRGAVLHGVAQAFRDLTSNPWQDKEARYRQISIDAARARLGAEEFQRAYSEGRRFSVEEVFDFALGRVRSS